jgi:hypothetical protein
MEVVSIGLNQHHIDGPFVHSVLYQDATREVIQQYITLLRRVATEHGEVYLLLDNQRGFMMDAGARQELFQFGKERIVKASAIVGGGILFRTAVNMMMRALELVRIAPTPTAFFPTPETARHWLQQQQARNQPRQGIEPRRL